MDEGEKGKPGAPDTTVASTPRPATGNRKATPAEWLVHQASKARTPILIAILVLTLMITSSWLFAKLVVNDTSFLIHATGNAVRIDLTCKDVALWNLPGGTLYLDDPEQPLQVAKDTTELLATATPSPLVVGMRGGASVEARIELIEGEEYLTLIWTGDARHRCVARNDSPAVEIESGGETIPLLRGSLHYQSALPASHLLRDLVLPFAGRVLIGAEVPVDTGPYGFSTVPMLRTAGIEARTHDPATGQKRTIHSESIETSSQIDTHACLDQLPEQIENCVMTGPNSAGGLLLLHEFGPSRSTNFSLQAWAVGRSIGVRHFRMEQRKIGVTCWARLISAPITQIFAALGLIALNIFFFIRTLLWNPGHNSRTRKELSHESKAKHRHTDTPVDHDSSGSGSSADGDDVYPPDGSHPVD